MNKYVSFIRFYNFVLKMQPFFIDSEKMEKVEVEIYTGEPGKEISFTLSGNIVEIAIPQEGEPKMIKGKMFLDVSKERIVFEGLYRIKNKSNTFWVEIDPNAHFFKNERNSDIVQKVDISLKCEDYPLSVGSVTFDIAAADSSLTGQRNGKPEVIAKLNDLMGHVYLHTILSESNKEIRGINTCLGNDSSGFVGELGIFRNKVYIDGEMMEDGITNCYIYAELGEVIAEIYLVLIFKGFLQFIMGFVISVGNKPIVGRVGFFEIVYLVNSLVIISLNISFNCSLNPCA